MSTKIYEAYYVPSGMKGIWDVKKILSVEYEKFVIDSLTKYQDKIYKDVLTNKSYLLGYEKTFLESKGYNGIRQIDEPLRNVYSSELKTLIEANSRSIDKGTLLDFGSSMVVFQYDDETYVQFFGFDYRYKDVFNRMIDDGLIVDFHYQNQSDQPESITDKEWKKREEVWDKIFLEDDVPSRVGLIFNFLELIEPIVIEWFNSVRQNPRS